MESAPLDGVPTYSVQDDVHQNEAAAVKQEQLDKDANHTSPEDVKKEPQHDDAAGEETPGRSTRKRKLNSMAETSDLSDQSGDENYSKSQPKRKSRGGAVSTGRPRGRPRKSAVDVPTNQADPSRNPRIVLKNIATDDVQGSGGDETPNTGRLKRSKRTPALKSGTRGRRRSSKGRGGDDDEEEEEDEEDNGEVDYDEELDDDDDEDFVPKKGKPGRPSKAGLRTRGKGKGKTKAKHESEDEEEDEEDEDAAVDGAGDGSEANPNAIKTGQYLIEKSDMRRLENYPIWRMEGPNMLRKFEMIIQDGAVRHKSLYAYSSWAQSMLDLYEKIQVTQTSSQDGETIVQINPEYLPPPPDMNILESKYGNDQLLHAYAIYLEALFRQAVDPNFLKKIRLDVDSPYVAAINHIDAVIRDRIISIENEISMKDEFKNRVRNCPNMKTIRRQNWSQTDQATTNKSTEKGVRSVLLFGYGYDTFTMEEDKSKGVEVAQEVVIGSTMEKYLAAYHGLIHFTYALLKRCQDKVKLTSAMEPGAAGDYNVLERCLQDRGWILQTFEDLKNLLTNEQVS